MTADRYCIPVDAIVAVHAMMAVLCMFSIHIFSAAFQVMLIEAMQLPYKLLYPRGDKFS
jgi:hypothetical protein